MEKIKEGDYVLLYCDSKRKWVIQVSSNERFHTHKGIIDLKDVVGQSYGDCIDSTLKNKFWIIKPNFCDFISVFKRPTQIIYPKDAGLIILKLGITPGKKIIEAGTGSGSLTAIMAQMVKPDGHVFTYDMSNKFLEAAKRNISKINASDYVTFINSDARKGFGKSDCDAVVLDLADPWNVVPHAYNSLKGGCTMASFSPTINQVEKTTISLRENGFISVESCECFLREMHIEEGKSRPISRMIGHTGYLTFARKINPQ